MPYSRCHGEGKGALESSVLLSAGARVEQVRLRSDGDKADAEDPRFGTASSRRFTPLSLSLGAQFDLGQGWQASATLGRTERAPADYELYANGVHVATAAYERGDATLPMERRRHLELGLEVDLAPLRAGVQLRHAARQSRVPVTDTATAGHTLLDLLASGRVGDGAGVPWLVRLTNVGNRLATHASALATVRGLSPQGAQALSAALQWSM